MEKEILALLKDLQPTFDFEEDADFIEEGYLDSFDVVTLVVDLEDKFSVLISALDILPENFASIKAMCQLIEKSEKR